MLGVCECVIIHVSSSIHRSSTELFCYGAPDVITDNGHVFPTATARETTSARHVGRKKEDRFELTIHNYDEGLLLFDRCQLQHFFLVYQRTISRTSSGVGIIGILLRYSIPSD